MAQTLKKRCNFTIRRLLDLGNNLLRVNSKSENFGLFALHPCYCFTCCLTAPWPTFGYYRGNSLITAFGLSILGQRWLGGVRSLHLTECPVGFDNNAITHLATHSKLQKILLPDLQPVFRKCGNASNTQNSYSWTLWWPLDLHNTSLDARFSVKNFNFYWQIKSMS